VNELWWCMKQKLKNPKAISKCSNWTLTIKPTSSPSFRKRPPNKHHDCSCLRPTSRPPLAATPNVVNGITKTNTFSHRIILESNNGSIVAHHLSCCDYHNNAGDHREQAHRHYTLPKPTSALYTSRNDNVHCRIPICQWQIHSFLFVFYFIVNWFTL